MSFEEAVEEVQRARRLTRWWTELGVPVIRRRCDLEFYSHGPHTWERLNPATMQPYRRGRVVFLCDWWRSRIPLTRDARADARCATCGHDAGDHPFDSYGDARRHCWHCACTRYR